MNLYAYAGNNPISYDDPFGLCDKQDQDVCNAAGAAKGESQAREQDDRELRAKEYARAFRETQDMLFGAVLGMSQGSGDDDGAAADDAAAEIGMEQTTLADAASKEEAAATTEAGPLPGTQYTADVMEQIQNDKYHGFPKAIDRFAADQLPVAFKGGDGVTRTRISLPGTINKEQGNYVWIFEPNGDINHRLFEKR